MTRVTTARFAKQRVTLPTINVKEAGYLFTYLSYEDQSNNYVYFDDYKVTYTPTNVVQYNEYYPYGLQTATSWTRENATGNNFLGNGGTELNTTTSLYDLEYRNYDPALARMHQVDPMADKYASYTPYNYSFNAPSNFNDVNGADPSPGEKDHVTRRGNQILRPGITGGSDFSRIYRGGSQYSIFDAGWSPGQNSLSIINASGGGSEDASIYNKWCGCRVNAFEVLMQDPEHQNAAYRERALAKINDFTNNRNDRESFSEASFYPNELSHANAILNFGSTLIGGGEELIKWVKRYPNGPRDLARGLRNLTGVRIGTTEFAKMLTNAGTDISKLGKVFGYVGLVTSVVDFTLNYDQKNGYDKASFLIGAGVFLLSLNPATAVVGLVYGGAQLASFYFNDGKSAEQSVSEFVEKLTK